MSYDIRLECPVCREALPVDHFTDGGTHPLGGSCEADLNVTYNYAPHFDFKSLNDRQAGDTIPDLEAALERLGDKPDDDYWAATPGNAGRAVAILLGWAKRHPTGIWGVR